MQNLAEITHRETQNKSHKYTEQKQNRHKNTEYHFDKKRLGVEISGGDLTLHRHMYICSKDCQHCLSTFTVTFPTVRKTPVKLRQLLKAAQHTKRPPIFAHMSIFCHIRHCTQCIQINAFTCISSFKLICSHPVFITHPYIFIHCLSFYLCHLLFTYILYGLYHTLCPSSAPLFHCTLISLLLSNLHFCLCRLLLTCTYPWHPPLHPSSVPPCLAALQGNPSSMRHHLCHHAPLDC